MIRLYIRLRILMEKRSAAVLHVLAGSGLAREDGQTTASTRW